MLSVIDTATV